MHKWAAPRWCKCTTNTESYRLIQQSCWDDSVKLMHDHLIKLFMIKNFYIVHAQLWLLIVVLVEINVPFVMNELVTWVTTCVPSSHRQTTGHNPMGISERHHCCYRPNGFLCGCNTINHSSISVIDRVGGLQRRKAGGLVVNPVLSLSAQQPTEPIQGPCIMLCSNEGQAAHVMLSEMFPSFANESPKDRGRSRNDFYHINTSIQSWMVFQH